MSSSQSKKQLVKNVFSLTAVQGITYVLPLISVPVISRIIGPGKFGVINFAAAYIAYFNLLIIYSFDFTATRKIAKDPDNVQNRNKVFCEVFYAQCLLFVFAAIVFTVLLFTVPELSANKTIIVFSFLVCIGSLFTQNWLFQAMQDLSKVALFNLISRLLVTTTILLVVRKNSDYIWQPFLIGVIQTVIAIWSFTWAFRKYQIKFIKMPLIQCLKVLWDERIIFFSLVFVNLYTSTNTFILGVFQNSEQVGYYTAGLRLMIVIQIVLTMPLGQAFYPFIGKAFGESREKGLRMVQKLVPFIIAYIGLAAVVLFIIGPIVIKLFYGHKFEPAIPVFQILTFIPLIFALNNVLGVQIMLNLGMDKYFFRITAGAGILSVLINLLMVRRWGCVGSAANLLFAEVFIFICMYFVLKKKGLNAFNTQYFKLSVIMEYLKPLSRKFLPASKA